MNTATLRVNAKQPETSRVDHVVCPFWEFALQDCYNVNQYLYKIEFFHYSLNRTE
jgi:hypothetical protein